MSLPSIAVRRLPLVLRPDASRVLVRPFLPTMTGPKSINPNDAPRALKILTRILSLSDEQVLEILGEVFHEFGNRHQRIREVFVERFEQVKGYLPSDRPMSEERKLLIGSYFTSEYSLESAALFNPSIVPHPDQTNLPEGSIRVILSMRATGEGHVSSITFRSGVVGRNGEFRARHTVTLCHRAAADLIRHLRERSFPSEVGRVAIGHKV